MENYLVNPVNPMVRLKHKAWTQEAFRRSEDGRFGPLRKKKKASSKAKKPIWMKKRKAAKKPTTALIVYKKKEKNPMSPLLLLNKKRRKAVRKTKVITLNPHRRTVAKKASRRRTRRFHHNPLLPKMGNVGKMVLYGAAIVAGAMGGSFLIAKVSEKFPVLQKPMVKVGLGVGAGLAAYYLLMKTKKVKPELAMVVSAAVMSPVLIDVKDMLMAKLMPGAAAPTQVSYAGEELSAYVPEAGMGAWIPEGQMGADGYGSSY